MALPFAYEVLISDGATPDFSQPIPEHAAGDRLVAVLTQDLGGTAIAVAGWTEIGTQSRNEDQRTAIFEKTAASSAEADLVATGHNDEWIGAIIVIRGAHATTPFPQDDRTDSANSNTAFLDSGTVTTDQANIMLLYIWSFDGLGRLIPENPSHIVGLTKAFNSCCQIIGYRNQPSAGTSQVVRALHERATEGGTAIVIAVADATPSTPQMAPFFTETYEVIHRYGGGVSPPTTTATFGRHDSSSDSFENAEGLGATTIDGINLLALTTTYGTVGTGVWGNASTINVSGSAIDATGRWVGGAVPVSPTANMADKLFSVEFGLSNTGNIVGTKGAIIVFESSSSDWVAFTLSVKSGMVAAVLYRTFIDVSNATPLDSGGTINWGAVNKTGYLYHKVGTNTSSIGIRVRQAILLSKSVAVDGCAASPVNGPSLLNLGFWGIDDLVRLQGTGQVRIPYSLDIGDGTRPTFSKFLGASTELPVAFGSSFRRRFWNVGANNDNAQITINAGPDDVADLSNCIFATESSQEFIVDAGSDPAADYNFSGLVLSGFKITNNADGVVLNSGTSVGGQTLTLNGGGLEDFTIQDSTQSPAVITNDPGNIADCSFTSAGTGHAVEISAPITADFFGNVFMGYGANGTTDAALYNNSGGLVTLTLAAGDATPTVRNGTGASTVFDAPTQTTTFSGFPTADNSNDIAPEPVIGFYSSASSAGFIAGLDTSDTEYSAGSFTVSLSDYAGVTHVVGDAIGWVRTDYIPVDASNPPSAVSIAAAFREITSEEGDALVGNGTPALMDKVNYIQADTLFTFAAGPVDFESALDKKEAISSNVVGLEDFETAAIRELRFISSKYGNEILLPSPLTAAASIDASTSPIFENFLMVRAGNPTDDPFEHGLASTAVGLDTRPEIRMISSLFIGATDGGGASAGDIADAVLDEVLAGHTTDGTLGKVVADTLEKVSSPLIN